MLLHLHVKNMALIKELEIDFGKGLNILTGETGAGKSILIGSINVALGMQSFKGFVREDEKNALVELVFDVEEETAREKIRAMDIELEDGQVILSRRLVNGRSISKVNGETVTVAAIKELASVLIDIHGQHEHQSLLYKKNHLQILDEYAKEELETYKQEGIRLYESYMETKRQLEEFTMDEASRKKELDFLEFEIGEIEDAQLLDGEDDELEHRYQKLSNARKIAQSVGEAYELSGNGEPNALDMISMAVQRIQGVSSYDQELEGFSEQLGEIENLISDFNRELSGYLDSLTFDEYEFVQITDRLNVINHLKTKYGHRIADILSYKEDRQQRYQELVDYDARREKLQVQFEKQTACLRKNAEKMSAIRQKFAGKLAEVIQKQLEDLNFLETNFQVVVEPTAALSANGHDEACFMISMNPGSPVKPLGDVASGGELSRIMLAIKTVLADKDQTETLIFDEIDVGISGRTAQKVSEKMAVIARSRQILCITHLAQIASMADNHFYIEKNIQGQNTVTSIRRLSEEESVEELARILGGTTITATTLQSAKEMKEMADASKKY